MEDVNKLYHQLVDGDYFTDEELQLATYIGGYDIETLNDCIYHRYGYRDFEQMKGYE